MPVPLVNEWDTTGGPQSIGDRLADDYNYYVARNITFLLLVL